MAALAILALLLVAIALGYLLLDKRPGYGVWYGLARLSGAPLDIGPVNWTALTRRATSNDALVCPSKCCAHAKPDREPKAYTMPPDDLLARLKEIALAETNTLALPSGRAHTARFIQYTRLMRFPDTIDVEAFALPGGQSTLAIYSRSLLGREDFGVNRARVARWLAKLDQSS
jgi:uncharacterized protein (DUF1499 family)